MTAYYNEIDPFAAAWLRNLIAAGLIAPGEVDTRSIADVRAADLVGFVQCHFFAGVGGWSLALRLAGWPDDRHVWTGSCPCQPFSGAGLGLGTADERHLWPELARLIGECRPSVCFGEQVASAAGRSWLASVRSDLEGMGYGVGAADLCAAGAGAPHIRQRLFWVADAQRAREPRRVESGSGACRREVGQPRDGSCSPDQLGNGCEAASRVADAMPAGRAERWAGTGGGSTSGRGGACGMDDSMLAGLPAPEREAVLGARRRDEGRAVEQPGNAPTRESMPSAVDIGWDSPDWLFCTDGKWRPVEPGASPLAHGIPARVGRLRGYGNAIVPQVAAEWIGAFLDVTEGRAA